jgi:hypothetical protein
MVRKYRDPVTKTAREKSIEPFGYLDELEKLYDDPIAHFKAYVADKNRQEEAEAAEYIVKERKDTALAISADSRKCFGYAPITTLFRELGIDVFMNNRQRGKRFGYSTAKIMELLVISRILNPGSKKQAYENRGRYFGFEKEDLFSLDDVYHSLTHFAAIEEDLQKHIASRIAKQYERQDYRCGGRRTEHREQYLLS